jgi:hypothetical protein
MKDEITKKMKDEKCPQITPDHGFEAFVTPKSRVDHG